MITVRYSSGRLTVLNPAASQYVGRQGVAGAPAAIVATVVTNTVSSNYLSNGGPGDTVAARNVIGPGGLTIDGHLVQLGETVFFYGQAYYAGLYVCTNDGSLDGHWVLTRDARMQTAATMQSTMVVAGPVGTANKYSVWLCGNTGTITIGPNGFGTLIFFKQVNGTQQILPGTNITISGNTISASGVGDLSFVWNQSTASTSWVINHNLNKYPGVSTQDSAGTNIVGSVAYNDLNTLTVSFTNAFAGKAYLN